MRRLRLVQILAVAASVAAVAMVAATCAGRPDVSRGNGAAKLALLIAREGSQDLGVAITGETNVMIDMIERAGYRVEVASETGQPLVARHARLTPNLKLSEVRPERYVGLIIPCMNIGLVAGPQKVIEIVKEFAGAGKPIAAQHSAVLALDAAGLLDGRRFALQTAFPSKGTYVGDGVVQDGSIITSGICSFGAASSHRPDGTKELTRLFIKALSET